MPDGPLVRHWRAEIGSFRQNAIRRFAPSMRERLDIAKLYAGAIAQLEGLDYEDRAPRPWPSACPFTLHDLLNRRRAELEAVLSSIEDC